VLGARARWRDKQPGGGSAAVGIDWERKTVWTAVAACTMAMPACERHFPLMSSA
jgi:hypothetical protein